MKLAIWLANSLRWFITATVRVARVRARPRPECVCRRLLRHVNDSLSVKEMSLSGWRLYELWPGQGHISSGELTLCGQETLLSDFTLERKHSCNNLQCHCSTYFKGYCNMRGSKSVRMQLSRDNSMRHLSDNLFFLQKPHSGDFFVFV